MTLPIGGKQFKWQPIYQKPWGFPAGPRNKEPVCQPRRHKRSKVHPWIRNIPWRRAWKPMPGFCLGNPMDRGAWWPTVHRGCKNLDHWSKLTCMHAWRLEGTSYFKCWKKRTVNIKFCIQCKCPWGKKRLSRHSLMKENCFSPLDLLLVLIS